jgi:hypothetical protein
VEVDGRPITARQLAAIPGFVLWQDGDAEKTFVFPVALFETVAALVKPRKRRRLSAERKAKLEESNVAFRFPASQSIRQRCQATIPTPGGPAGPFRDQ